VKIELSKKLQNEVIYHTDVLIEILGQYAFVPIVEGEAIFNLAAYKNYRRKIEKLPVDIQNKVVLSIGWFQGLADGFNSSPYQILSSMRTHKKFPIEWSDEF